MRESRPGRSPRPRTVPAPSPRLAEGPKRITVMIVDSQALFRSGLIRLLEEDERLEVVAVAADGEDVAAICQRTAVDVVVSELEPGGSDIIGITRMLSALSPRTRVVILASSVDSRLGPALSAGASGFLLKDTQPEAIRSTVVSVHLGEQVLCREAAQQLLDQTPTRRLTGRETDVLRMVAGGAGNGEIARQLDISEKTVRNYISRLYRKLSLQDRHQVRLYAIHVGLVPPGATSLERATVGRHFG